ncbi:cytochrome P450 [Ensifer sp. Root142]|uniref:cytochrome P450 n=1 Tax=Ensifer sp. Root142 TaxID=1736461 RepID=UPI000B2F4E22|nr:cytochrome P450 [Ensifer sp. Root142]
MLDALVRTLKWVAYNQRELIRTGFDSAETFQVELILPSYNERGSNHQVRFSKRRVAFFWNPEHFAEFHKARPEEIDVSSSYGFLKPYFGDESVFVTSGSGHAPAKQAVYRTIRQHMTIEADDLMFFSYSVLERFPTGVYPALKPIQEVTAAFLLRTVFDVQGSAATTTIEHAIAAAGNASGTFLILPDLVRWTRRWGVGLAIRRQRLHLRHFIMDQLQGMLVAHNWVDETPEAARTEIIDNLMTLLIAGFETTSTTIAWLLYELASNNDLQADLRSEVSERIRENPLDYFADDKTLLARTVQETLRLHPSIPFIIREVKAPITIGGVALRASDYAVLSIEEMHRRGFDGGTRFDPSRYQTATNLPKLATFGGGAKICPGRAIAVQQCRIIVSLLLAKYLIGTTDKTRSYIARNRVSATPAGGMLLKFDRIQ